jgi:hypothetical protein
MAEKSLVRPVAEIDTDDADDDADDAGLLALMLVLAEVDAAGALLLLLLLLLQAARSSAAETAVTVSPARADTEYNDVPRLFSRDMPLGMCETRSVWSRPLLGRALLPES